MPRFFKALCTCAVELFNKNSIIGIYGDKVDLIDMGIDFEGIDEANNRAYLKTTGGDWQKVKKSGIDFRAA